MAYILIHACTKNKYGQKQKPMNGRNRRYPIDGCRGRLPDNCIAGPGEKQAA